MIHYDGDAEEIENQPCPERDREALGMLVRLTLGVAVVGALAVFVIELILRAVS